MLLKILVVVNIFISCDVRGSMKDRKCVVRSFPYVVSVQAILEGTNNSVHVCGGSIIQPDAVLTAGRCLALTASSGVMYPLDSRSGIVVFAGAPTVSDKCERAKIEDFQARVVKEIIVHSMYKPTIMVFDVAILKLKTPLIFGPTVQPVPLVSNGSFQNQTPWDYYRGKRCFAAGWESPLPFFALYLHEVKMELVDDELCNVLLKDLKFRSQASRWMLKNELCTFSTQDVCEANTGGPLVCEGHLVGVAVRSTCMEKQDLVIDIWARIDKYEEWIESTVGEKNRLLMSSDDTTESISTGCKIQFCELLYIYYIWKLFVNCVIVISVYEK